MFISSFNMRIYKPAKDDTVPGSHKNLILPVNESLFDSDSFESVDENRDYLD